MEEEISQEELKALIKEADKIVAQVHQAREEKKEAWRGELRALFPAEPGETEAARQKATTMQAQELLATRRPRSTARRAQRFLKAQKKGAAGRIPAEMPPRIIRRSKYYREGEVLRIRKRFLFGLTLVAFLEARRRKQRSRDEYDFEMHWLENLDILTNDILHRTYQPSSGVAFITRWPVVREIVAAPFRDRVIHHLLYNLIVGWVDKRLINNSFSCRKGKGTLYGVKRIQKDIREVSAGYTREAYAIQLDIQGYFMSLPRAGLFRCIKRLLMRMYPYGGEMYKMQEFLWHQIIMDNPIEGIRRRPPLNAWNELPASKCLFLQEPGIGIVIGNLSSQLLSNIYLDSLDKFVTRGLGYKHYGRYVDDFYLIVTKEQKPQAMEDVKLIERHLLSLGLILHPNKRHVQEVKKGVKFLGMVVYPFGIVPGKRFKQNFYRAVHHYAMGRKKDATIVSYLGYCKHILGTKLCKQVFASVGWVYNY